MDISSTNLGGLAREVMERRGIDPTTVPPRPGFDLADHLIEQAEATLNLILPPRFRHAEPDDRQVRQWIGTYLRDPTTCPGLLLLGPVGTGKSHQAFGALRRVVLESAKRCRRMTYAVTSHPEFNAAMRPQSDDRHLRALADYQTVDLLVFDDLAAGKSTDWTEDTLYRLMDARWANQLPTITTTNLDADGLRADVDERVVSRLSTSVQIGLKGSDRRRGGDLP
ncbi:ATP-binding protein [Micromonospora sp. NPDC048935]|uniref:ATP-binding protein n=1 Tax=Micromonospora sp. NPDC048935 TaxID=3364262 RepID=UPI003720799D